MTTASVELLADSSQIRTATRDLERLQAQGAPVERAANQVANATNKANASLGKFGRTAGQAGIQIQQFVGQVQGGQSALLALSQQGADLGFVLGAPLAGAVIGIGASIAGFLLPALVGASTDVKELRDRIEDLGDTAQKTVAQIRFLAQENEDAVAKLSKDNEKLAKRIQDLTDFIDNANNEAQLNISADAQTALDAYTSSVREAERELKVLRAELDTNNQDIIKLNQETTDLTKKKNELRDKTQSLTTSLQAQIIALESGAQAAEVYAATQQAIANGTQEQLPTIIELINRKYELADAQRAAAMAAREQAAEQKALDSVLTQIAANTERQAQAERARLEQAAGGNLGLTRLQALEQQYAREKQLLEEAQAAGIDSTIAYHDRLIELERTFNEQKSSLQQQGNQILSNSRMESLNIVGQAFGNMAEIARRGGEDSFATYKAFATAQAITSGILATVATLAQASLYFPPPVPQILAGTVAGLAAVNVAQIQSQQYTPRAVGGQVMGGRPYLVGERGPELFTPNASGNGRITPFSQLMNEARTNSGDTNATSVVNINLANGEEFRRPESRRQVEAAAYRGMMKAYRRNS